MKMKFRFRQPELGPTLVTLCLVALMFGLGTWQIFRLEWKTRLLADIEAAQTQAPRDLASYSPETLAHAEWHNIVVKGHFLHDKELYATPRYLKDQMGYAVLTPLVVDAPDGPRYVLINRGWVPPEKKTSDTRPGGNPDSVVTVEGVVRGKFVQNMFRPDNVPAKNLWFWYDLPAMAAQEKLPLLPVMIDATRVTLADGTVLKDGPIPFPLEVSIRNDHLGYAITWFLIGLSGIVMFGIYHAEEKNAERI